MSDGRLLLGASGAVGKFLLPALVEGPGSLVAWSRSARPDAGRIDWREGELFRDALPEVDAILSAGPIDGLVSALSRSPNCRPGVVVALSSSSAAFKRESVDAQERALAATLAASEAALAGLCGDRETRCVILRPTLIYGGDDARHFGAVVAQADRFGRVLLPRSARGLRMPIHADDLAQTMLKALQAHAISGVFDVGGGETLPYDAMIERVLRARGSPAAMSLLPDPLFTILLRCARAAGLLRGLTDAVVQRMGEDLVVDDARARFAIGHAPGPFRPGPIV